MKLKTYEKLLLYFTVVVVAFTAGFFIGRNTAETKVIVSSVSSRNVQEPQDSIIQRININSADINELTKLPGIGTGLASAIISYREKNGSFKAVGEIINVDGIGSAIYEQIRNYITV